MKDLNLLYVFEALWRDRSVTVAAENLGLTQAAVSSALKRLRVAYGDKLFMLVGRRMEPTAVAIDIAQPLLESLALVRKTAGVPLPFCPAESTRTFSIRTRDIGEVAFLPALNQRFREVAPNAKLHSVFITIEETLNAMANGRLDVALGYLPALEHDIHCKRLFSQKYVCVMRKDHPLAGQRLTLETYLSQDHLLVENSGSGHQILERALIDAGVKDRIKVRMPQYLSAPHCLLGSDLVWAAPEFLAETLSQYFPLVHQPLPMNMQPFEVSMYWHDRYHRDSANKWLRSQIVSLFEADPPGVGLPNQRHISRMHSSTAAVH